MKKLLFTLLITLTVITTQAQESEFTTTHATVGGQATKMNIHFKVYNDSLVWEYTDKKTVKMLTRMNQPTTFTMPYPMTKEVYGSNEQFKYQDKLMKIMVVTSGKPSVKIQSKDEFSEVVTEQLYFNM